MEFKQTNHKQFHLLFYSVQIRGPIPMNFIQKERYEVERNVKCCLLNLFQFYKRFVLYHLNEHQIVKYVYIENGIAIMIYFKLNNFLLFLSHFFQKQKQEINFSQSFKRSCCWKNCFQLLEVQNGHNFQFSNCPKTSFAAHVSARHSFNGFFCTIFAGSKSLFFLLIACGFLLHNFVSRVQKSKVHRRRREKYFRGVKLNRCEKNRLNRKRSRFRFFRHFKWIHCFFLMFFMRSRIGKQYEPISLAHAQLKNQFDTRVIEFGGHHRKWCAREKKERDKKRYQNSSGKRKYLTRKIQFGSLFCV